MLKEGDKEWASEVSRKKGMQSSEEKWPLRENTTPKGSGRGFRLSHWTQKWRQLSAAGSLHSGSRRAWEEAVPEFWSAVPVWVSPDGFCQSLEEMHALATLAEEMRPWSCILCGSMRRPECWLFPRSPVQVCEAISAYARFLYQTGLYRKGLLGMKVGVYFGTGDGYLPVISLWQKDCWQQHVSSNSVSCPAVFPCAVVKGNFMTTLTSQIGDAKPHPALQAHNLSY